MDFHSMKRKQLQALCKKHNIPANLSNLEMANRISEVLKEKEDPPIRRPREGQEEHVSEAESADVIANKKVKKVRFSPEHELIEFSRSPEIKRRGRRSMVVSKSSSLSVVKVSCNDKNQETLGRRGRALRSRELKPMEGNVNEKRVKNPENGKGVNTNASAIEILDNGKSQEGNVDTSVQEMQLRGKNFYNIRAKDNGKSNETASSNVDNDKLIKKIVDNPGRVTRSRLQKLTEISVIEENRGRKVAKRTGSVAQVIAENKENKAVGTGSFTNRGDADEVELANNRAEREKSKGQSLEEVLENKRVEEHDVNEPQIVRRSRRNAGRVAHSEMLISSKRKNENDVGNDLRKKSKLMATDCSGVDAEGSGCEVNLGRGVSLKMKEPIKVEPRRSNRRKNVIEADELKAETENGYPSRCSLLPLETGDEKKVLQPNGVTRRSRCKDEKYEEETKNKGALRSSVPQLGTAGEASKDEKKVLQPTGATGRSKRKTLSVKLVSSEETETRRVLRSSVPELGIACEDAKDAKTVLQPTGVLGRSRRKTLSTKIVSADEKVHTHLAVEKLETETENTLGLNGSVPQVGIAVEALLCSKISCFKSVDEENDTNLAVENLKAEERKTETRLVEKECSAVQHSTRRSRRIASQCKSPGEIGGDSDKVNKKRDVVKTKNDPSSVAETVKETSSKKTVLTASSGKVAGSGKRRCRLDDYNVFDASSHNGLEVRENFVAKAQPSGSEGFGSTSNMGFSADTSVEGIHGKKPDTSLAENDGRSDMKLMNRTELEDKNASPSNTEIKEDFEDDQVSISNIGGMEKVHLPLEIYLHELLEQNIADVDKNDTEAHVSIETEGLGCNEIDNQVNPEGSNVSGCEGFDETGSSTDSLQRGDQTVVMEVTEAESHKCLQPSVNEVDRVDEAIGIFVEENMGSDLPREENQTLLDCSKISKQETMVESTPSADNPLHGDQMDNKNVEVDEVEAEKCLQPNTCVVGELNVIAAEENLDFDETGQDDQVLPEVSKDSGKEGSAESGFSADSHILADQTDIMKNLEVAQAEADKCLQPCHNVVDHVGVVEGVFVQENLDLDETGQDDQALLEVSNDSGEEGSADIGSSADSQLLGDQTDISTDLKAAQTEADKCLQPCHNLVDHVDAVKVFAAEEKPDSKETGQDDQVLPEVLKDSGKEGSAESGFSSDSRLPGDQVDNTTDLEVAQTEADKLHPSPNVVGHVGVIKGVSVQESPNIDETRKDNQEGSNFSGNEGFADQTDARTDPAMANAEGDNHLQPSPSGVDHEVKGISVQGLDSEETKQAYISSPVLCNCIDVDHLEKSDYILDNNNEDTPPKAGAAECSERFIDYSHSRSIMNSKAPSSCLLRRVEGDNMTAGNEAFSNKVSSELTETDEDGALDIHKSASYQYCAYDISDFSNGERSAEIAPQDNLKKDHEVHTAKSSNSEDAKRVEGEFYPKSKCDEHGEFIVSNLFEAETRPGIMPQDIEAISDEYSLKNFDDQGTVHGSPSVVPTTICNSTRDHELDLIFEGYEATIFKDKQSEIVDADDSGCLESHESSKEEDLEFSISNLFDGERSGIKDSNKQVEIRDAPATSSTSETYNEVKFIADGSNLQEISPSKTVGDFESQAEQLKSPLVDTSITPSIIQMPETRCNAIETTGHLICLSKNNIVGSGPDDDECGKEKEYKIGVEGLTEMNLQDTDETNEQSMIILEKGSKPVVGEVPTDMKTVQSWTELELHNLFGTIFDNGTPGRNDTSSSRTEAANLTSTYKSISKSRYSLTKKEIEMEGERIDCEEIKNEIVGSPTSFNGVSHAVLNVHMEEKQLATPIKTDQTGSHGRDFDRTEISVVKFSDTMKENMGTQSKSDKKDTLSDNGEGFTCEGLNDVESVEMVNISSAVLSEAEYGGCGASEEQLTEKTVECLKEINLKVEEDKEVKSISLPESCPNEAVGNASKLTEGNSTSSSDSPLNFVQGEGCQDMLVDTVFSQSVICNSRICHTAGRDITQSVEAGFGLSNTDPQKSKKSNHLNACSEDSSILRETSLETFRGHLVEEVADISIFGTSPCHFSKFLEYGVADQVDSVTKNDDLCGTNLWNEKGGNSTSQDISDDYLEGDHAKTSKATEEGLTASMDQFSIPQLHFEEQAEELNINIHNISDVLPSECTETLKESDVADTIKEYIDSESSLSMISENSSVSFPIDEAIQSDERTVYENAALSENNVDVAERFMNTEDKVNHLETESVELKSPACVDFLAEGSTAVKPSVETKGFDVKLDSQKQIEAEDAQHSSFKQLCSTAKKNARTILIHGTPGKVPAVADMKENALTRKSSNVGDLTTVRPAKRKALQDVRWK